jgi:NADPH:quinone reductase
MRMPKAIRLYENGGPDRLRWEEVPVGAPGPGEVLLRQTAVGVNFIDVYMRTGLYPHALPMGMGYEGAGVVAAVGRRVRDLRVGDRVGYYTDEPGAYAEQRVMPVEDLVKLPPYISDEQAAAVMLKGLTTWGLVRECFKVRRGTVLLLTAAAGGVGMILGQWARALGARVIGAVGSEDKAAIARRHGCNVVLVGYQDLARRVRECTRGKGVEVVYDGIGQATFMAGLDSLAPRGLMVTFGNASGAVAPFAPLELTRRGSLYVTRPTAGSYLPDAAAGSREERELFGMIRRRRIKVLVGQRFPLREAARAHAELEARHTTGAIVLVP